MVYQLYFLLIKELTGICMTCIPFPSQRDNTGRFSLWFDLYRTHSTLCPPAPPFLLIATSVHGVGEWGLGAYNWIIVFIHPLSLLWSVRGKQQWQNCPLPSRAACDGAHGGSVLPGQRIMQLSMKAQSVCGKKMQFSHHHRAASYEATAA